MRLRMLRGLFLFLQLFVWTPAKTVSYSPSKALSLAKQGLVSPAKVVDTFNEAWLPTLNLKYLVPYLWAIVSLDQCHLLAEFHVQMQEALVAPPGSSQEVKLQTSIHQLRCMALVAKCYYPSMLFEAKRLVDGIQQSQIKDPWAEHAVHQIQNWVFFLQMKEAWHKGKKLQSGLSGLEMNEPFLYDSYGRGKIQNPFDMDLGYGYFLGRRLAPAMMNSVQKVHRNATLDRGWGWLERAVYINLDHREDRKELMEEQLLDIPNEKVLRISAVKDKKKPKIACIRSHIAVLRLAKKRGWKNVLILEDDHVFIERPASVSRHVDHVLKALGDKWDVIQLSAYVMACAEEPATNNVKRVRMATISSAYLVNEHFYDQMIQIYRMSAELDFQTDQGWIALQYSSNWYVMDPPVAGQAAGMSDLQGKRTDMMSERPLDQAKMTTGKLYCTAL